MLSLPTLILLLAAATFGQAHFASNNTAPFQEDPSGGHVGSSYWASPTRPTDAPNSVRCGRDNMNWAAKTDVLKVRPGDTIEFVLTGATLEPWTWDNEDLVQWENCPEGRGACNTRSNNTDKSIWPFKVLHLGSVIMHLSKVPVSQDIHAYDGSGNWVKIYTLGLEIRKDLWPDVVSWLPFNEGKLPPRFIATIPKQTPGGQYLLRVDQSYFGQYDLDPQIYPSCAQIEVVSDVTGDLPEGINIPEAFQKNSPGMKYVQEHWPNGYTYPGGPLWDGEKLEQDYPPHKDLSLEDGPPDLGSA
ncbi:uncharacterized protein CC84DRAFT_1202321 [Paraphaeosphaeria sporulosa]|uniref:lytic cellulose monooxygenase (C4-dehydrogenating) n=1 Tax=Paraphaeosphaeria sporulosa TaxID=1460663 RepID=A0A177CS95_9PLEO|nr:uncharacterized protein CC84DRAFT_1202321 [Paraphaeosphaeria sporulosa]OAG09647.1 hypothetical protein CC84DRAFT_1202321 [Paraphaeosphaeria sporulosa]